MHNGEVAFEVETLAEAMALRRQLTTPSSPERKVRSLPQPTPVPESAADRHHRTIDLAVSHVESMFSPTETRLSPYSLPILKALGEIQISGKPWTMDQLAAWLKLDTSKSLPPLMMQFRKDVDRLGFVFDQVVTRKVVYTGGRKYSFYAPGPKALDALRAAQERDTKNGNLFIVGAG